MPKTGLGRIRSALIRRGIFTYPLELPGPRRYFDFQLFFRGTSTDLVQIDSLAISYSLPLADRAVGEVAVLADPFPPGGVVAVPAGRDTLFTYDIRAEFDSDTQVGFDGLHIGDPDRTDVAQIRDGGAARRGSARQCPRGCAGADVVLPIESGHADPITSRYALLFARPFWSMPLIW